MNHSAHLALEIRRRYCVVGKMKVARALPLFLGALLYTAIWGLILHFGARWLGVPIGPIGLGVTLLGIFVLVVLVLGMAALSSDADRVMGLTDRVAQPRHRASRIPRILA